MHSGVRTMATLAPFGIAIGIAVAIGLAVPPVRAADVDDMSVRLFLMQKVLAEQKGDVQAQYYLAQMYEHGLGTPQDPEQARLWYERAASKGHAMAKRHLQELARAKQEAASRAALEPVKAAVAAPDAAPESQVTPKTQTPVAPPRAAATADQTRPETEAAAEAARLAREKARAERKRAVEDYIRRQLANPVGDPFE